MASAFTKKLRGYYVDPDDEKNFSAVETVLNSAPDYIGACVMDPNTVTVSHEGYYYKLKDVIGSLYSALAREVKGFHADTLKLYYDANTWAVLKTFIALFNKVVSDPANKLRTKLVNNVAAATPTGVIPTEGTTKAVVPGTDAQLKLPRYEEF